MKLFLAIHDKREI